MWVFFVWGGSLNARFDACGKKLVAQNFDESGRHFSADVPAATLIRVKKTSLANPTFCIRAVHVTDAYLLYPFAP